MITVRLHEDGRRVVLEAADIAELLVDAIAAEHAEDPRGVAAGLDEIAQRRRTYEGLASLQEARDLPEHLVNEAAAALDAIREAFVASLSAPLDFAMNEDDARRLAVQLSRHAAQAAAARIEERAAR
ncbi:hypothetical protein [Streptomyces antimycoticus]|uniref:hypothetical protein n=1 Tax=Streptomyces antimycoticus TaxID=68175 RepID=UPI0036BC79B8